MKIEVNITRDNIKTQYSVKEVLDTLKDKKYDFFDLYDGFVDGDDCHWFPTDSLEGFVCMDNSGFYMLSDYNKDDYSEDTFTPIVVKSANLEIEII